MKSKSIYIIFFKCQQSFGNLGILIGEKGDTLLSWPPSQGYWENWMSQGVWNFFINWTLLHKAKMKGTPWDSPFFYTVIFISWSSVYFSLWYCQVVRTAFFDFLFKSLFFSQLPLNVILTSLSCWIAAWIPFPWGWNCSHWEMCYCEMQETASM